MLPRTWWFGFTGGKLNYHQHNTIITTQNTRAIESETKDIARAATGKPPRGHVRERPRASQLGWASGRGATSGNQTQHCDAVKNKGNNVHDRVIKQKAKGNYRLY